MPTAKTKEESKLNKLVEAYKKAVKSKGELEGWSDAYLLRIRDKMRKESRKTRGHWTFDFYESLQAINKESIKRELNPQTKEK